MISLADSQVIYGSHRLSTFILFVFIFFRATSNRLDVSRVFPSFCYMSCIVTSALTHTIYCKFLRDEHEGDDRHDANRIKGYFELTYLSLPV